jgi:hypothetical protein
MIISTAVAVVLLGSKDCGGGHRALQCSWGFRKGRKTKAAVTYSIEQHRMTPPATKT